MWFIDEEKYRQGNGRLVSVEQENRGYRSLADAQKLMKDYARAAGDIVMYDPDGMFAVVNGEGGWNYRYVIYEQ
jgi:hypothetical protein